MLPTQLQQYVHLSRYARWLEDQGRRETWEETVDRYVTFFDAKFPHLDLRRILRDPIENLEVMPSMRALMTAGPALDNENLAGFNCSYAAVDDPLAFSEILYILMCGTGVGFSVERQCINQLPTVPLEMCKTPTTIVVEDSKRGWAEAFRTLISMLYVGQIPSWDVSGVRPRGARLKTFGGRASGPEPLEQLFRFAISLFKGARGRKLTSVECHDLVCKIADIVVVGGVRRSALISLSNLSDDRMRHAKTGAWWETNPQRALANNSAVYTERPDAETFLSEWAALVASKSGERGIFSRLSAAKQAELHGRRDPNHAFGTNPSLRAGTLVLTSDGVRPIESLEGVGEFDVPVGEGSTARAICRKSSPSARLYRVVLASGRSIYATAEHRWPVVKSGGWVKTTTSSLIAGDRLPTGIRELPHTGTPQDLERGFLVGYWLGNGWDTTRSDNGSTQLGLCVPAHRIDLVPRLQAVLSGIGVETAFPAHASGTREFNSQNISLVHFFRDLGLSKPKEMSSFDHLWKNSGQFLRGLFEGLIASDGHVTADRTSFSSKNQALVKFVADLAYFSGYKPTIRAITDDIVIDRNGKKYSYPNYVIHNARWGTTKSKRHDTDRVVVVEDTGIDEPVWDLSVAHDSHTFVTEGVVTGNCGEILLRPCGLCNLSEVVVRAEDTLETLMAKVYVATVIGTLQSTLTNFNFVRPTWKQNAEDERLLGVSMTGIMDNASLRDPQILADWLPKLREHAINTNREWAALLGINPSVAITTVKPSGTVSQLVDSSSGIHPRYSPYYIRTVRADKKDPLAQFMRAAGFPVEDCAMKADTTDVFSFPVAAPQGSLMRDDITAIGQLEHYLAFKTHWCEHNPSITVYVRDHEWMEVGAWVYRNFENIGGISFLPHTDHTYMQAPYTECSAEEYLKALQAMPTADWSGLKEFERGEIERPRELSCTAGVCEIL